VRSAFVTVQVLVLGGSLLVAAGSKVRTTDAARGRTLLAVLWREVYAGDAVDRNRRGLRTLWWSLIVLEALLGASVLVPPSRTPGLAGVSVFLAGAMGLSAWGLRAARDATCGCFGTAARNTPWTIARSGWLFGSAVACLALGPSVIYRRGAVRDYALVAAIDAVVLGVCSDWARTAVTRAVVMLRSTTVRRVRDATLRAEALQEIAETAYWRELVESGVVRSREPARVWRQGDWIMMDFPGRWDGSEVRVVGGVCGDFRPRWCRVVLVDPSTQPASVRAAWDSLAEARTREVAVSPERPREQAVAVP
jgi:hypothetical protein